MPDRFRHFFVMSAADIANELLSIPEVKALVERMETIWCSGLKRYKETLPDEGEFPSSKSVKDSVWGMIDISREELIVVDSPVLQRLRGIRQLGVTFLTFPTADYSRFEHSLGVMHQVGRMITALGSRSSARDLVENLRGPARLAGLLHDIGHLPYSHLCERYYDEHPDADFATALRALSERLETQVKLSEFLTFLLIHIPSFQGLLVKNARYDKEDVAAVSLAVLGYSPPGKELLKQLTSNILDADKLDYMFRDAHYTGVPLPVDLERLLYKLKCLPPEAKTERGEKAGGLLAVDLGGAHLIEDLVISRRILSRQIYRHHKTLAAERLTIDILSQLKPRVLDLVAADDCYFSPVAHPGAPSLTCRLLEDLRTRNLPRRAIAISYAFLPRIPVGQDNKLDVPDGDRISWAKFEEDLGSRPKREDLQAKIRGRFTEICKLCNIDHAEDVGFFIDVPQTMLDSSDAELFVEYPDGRLKVFQPFAPKAAAFAHSPENFFYIYYSGSPKMAPAANVACESVLFGEYNLFFGTEASANAKINFHECEMLKRTLENKDPAWFKRARRLRPSSRTARTQQITIRQLASKFHKYGLTRMGITEDAIYRYLDQFPEQLVPSMINVLERIEYYDDEFILGNLPKLMRDGAAKDEAFVPITGLGESAATISYYLKKAGLASKSMTEALATGAQEITFYEDSVLSGKQVSTRILNWFGLEGESNDDRTEALSEAEQSQLRQARVRFCFLVARKDGIERLSEALNKVGLNNPHTPLMGQVSSMIQALQIHDNDKGALFAGTAEVDVKLLSFLSEVGTGLMLSTKHRENPEKWTEKRCGECALGYDNLGELIVFMFNAPTSTVTALWKCGGTYDGFEWAPLFPRSSEPVAGN